MPEELFNVHLYIPYEGQEIEWGLNKQEVRDYLSRVKEYHSDIIIEVHNPKSWSPEDWLSEFGK